MTKEELRYGNLINGFYENDEEKEVFEECIFLGYDPFNDKYWVESKTVIEEFTKFEPIPLTEEWLIKFGFEQFSENLYVIGEKLYQVCINNGSYIFRQLGSSICEVQYIHQLQNLFYSLTGKELKKV